MRWYPVVDGLVAESRGALGDLALVVREDEIHASTVDVELLAEVLGSHCRALEVPPWESLAPGAWPVHDVLRLRLLPYGEVVRVVLLSLPVELPRVGEGVLEIASGELAVKAYCVCLLTRRHHRTQE